MCRESGVLADPAVGDVSDPASVRAFFDIVEAAVDRLDVLVTNAGDSTATDPDADTSVDPGDRDIRHVSYARWRRMTATHLDGTFYCTRAAVALMIAHGGGSIVCMSSMAGTAGFGAVHYSAAEAGILGIVRSQARSLGRYGIRINAICPGSIDAGAAPQLPASAGRGRREPDTARPPRTRGRRRLRGAVPRLGRERLCDGAVPVAEPAAA
jgi:NAD(P)-dependent dehydrogenase (short-subunit alcohol dehydrogenase family)